MQHTLKKILLVISALALVLSACVSCDSTDTQSNITELKFSSTKDIVIEVGEEEKGGYVHVKAISKDDFSTSDVVFVSENPEIATFELEKEALTFYLYYKVTGVSSGETYVYAKTSDGSVVSEKVKVTVEGGQGSSPNDNGGQNNSDNKNDSSLKIGDWELITLNNHPVFWDELGKAEQVWGKYEDSKIGLDGEDYKSTNIININSILNKKIEDVEIYISNFSTPKSVSVDDILPVIATYLPTDLMKGMYDCTDSFIAQPKDGVGKTYYFIQYRIKTNRDSYDEYFYDMFIEIQVQNGSVLNFRISDQSFPNWAKKLEFNGYNEIEWGYDFGIN